MNDNSTGWTTDMTFPVGNGYSMIDVSLYIRESFEESMDFSVLSEKLCDKFSLAASDADLAISRALGGITRALTTCIENEPDAIEDPVANYMFNVVWESMPTKGLFKRKKVTTGYWYEWDKNRNK